MARPALTKLPPFTLLDESDPCRHPSVARAGEFRAVLERFVWRLYVARAHRHGPGCGEFLWLRYCCSKNAPGSRRGMLKPSSTRFGT